jgi:hypothetical protein
MLSLLLGPLTSFYLLKIFAHLSFFFSCTIKIYIITMLSSHAIMFIILNFFSFLDFYTCSLLNLVSIFLPHNTLLNALSSFIFFSLLKSKKSTTKISLLRTHMCTRLVLRKMFHLLLNHLSQVFLNLVTTS